MYRSSKFFIHYHIRDFRLFKRFYTNFSKNIVFFQVCCKHCFAISFLFCLYFLTCRTVFKFLMLHSSSFLSVISSITFMLRHYKAYPHHFGSLNIFFFLFNILKVYSINDNIYTQTPLLDRQAWSPTARLSSLSKAIPPQPRPRTMSSSLL